MSAEARVVRFPGAGITDDCDVSPDVSPGN